MPKIPETQRLVKRNIAIINSVHPHSNINESLKTVDEEEDEEFVIRDKLAKLKNLNADFQVGLNNTFEHSQDDQFAQS
jgi:hypothetical protein